MNPYAIAAIYKFELARTFRTLVQSILAPVITTSLYFIVFGSAIGSRMATVDGDVDPPEISDARFQQRALPAHSSQANQCIPN